MLDRVVVASQLMIRQPPDLAFKNDQPHDLSKGGFFPYGERPKLNDVLYLGSREVFSRNGARVTLSFDLLHPQNQASRGTDVTLIWEFWDGMDWKTLGTSASGGSRDAGHQFTDTSNAFTIQGKERLITYDCPDIAPLEVNGEVNYWIRALITNGGYGEDAKFIIKGSPPQSLEDWNYVPATHRPPLIQNLKVPPPMLKRNFEASKRDGQLGRRGECVGRHLV